MRLKKMYKRITAVMLSAAMLSAVAVSSAPAALAASYDKQGSAAYTYAHEIYVFPDTAKTSGKFDSFIIDFKTEAQAHATYWQMCQGCLDVSEIRETYPNAQDSTFYGGFQSGPERRNTLFSFWDVTNGNDESTVITTPARVYPAGDENSFGYEGNGHNYSMDYEWQKSKWYTYFVHCWKDKSTGRTFIGQWVRDVESGKWDLTCYFDTTMKETHMNGMMAQFLENFVSQYALMPRDIYLKNVYIFDKVYKDWKRVNQGAVGYSWNEPNKTGTHEIGFNDEYYFGKTGEPVENQTEYDNSFTNHYIGYNIVEPELPNFGNFIVDGMSIKNNQLEWTFNEKCSPMLEFDIDVVDMSDRTVKSYTSSRPEKREIQLDSLSDGNYLVQAKFKDVFDRVYSYSYEFDVVNGSAEGIQKTNKMGDVNNDDSVTLKDVVNILKYNIGLVSASDCEKMCGDINRDGKMSVKDAVLLQRFLLNDVVKYQIGEKITLSSAAEPQYLPEKNEAPFQPSVRTVKFTDNKNWGTPYVYAWNSTTGETNAQWPGVRMTYQSKNSYGQTLYKADLKTKYDMVIFTTATGSPQTQDIVWDYTVNGYWVTDQKTKNSTGIEVWVADTW